MWYLFEGRLLMTIAVKLDTLEVYLQKFLLNIHRVALSFLNKPSYFHVIMQQLYAKRYIDLSTDVFTNFDNDIENHNREAHYCVMY